MSNAVELQTAYYERTAAHYDSMHMASSSGEHMVALDAFSGLAAARNPSSILDVGAGTGRGIFRLQDRFRDARVVGLEPSQALRQVGYAKGLSEDVLVDGDAMAMPFPDNEFDFVIETGCLHHVPDPAKAVSEMVRVARTGVMISDSNCFGQGSAGKRLFKRIVRSLGLWNGLIYLQTKGRMYKQSEGDGIYYSYSVFQNADIVARKFPVLLTMNTRRAAGYDLLHDASHVMLMAMKPAD